MIISVKDPLCAFTCLPDLSVKNDPISEYQSQRHGCGGSSENKVVVGDALKHLDFDFKMPRKELL